MPFSASSASLLKALPQASRGGITLYVVDDQGRIEHIAGPEDGTTFAYVDGTLQVRVAPHRRAYEKPVPSTATRLIVTFDAATRPEMEPFLDGLLVLLTEKEQLERDLESMYPSSLALLEEVSMWGDTLPRLPAGQSEAEVAEMGLKALMVAASVERALYVRLDEGTRHGEILVQVRMDATGRYPVAIPFEGDPVVALDRGIVGRVLQDSREAILEAVPAGQLGDPGSPESLAVRQLIAVPVRYGVGARTVNLGVLMIMDKRANAYSSSLQLGSQESKLAGALASMLGSVLGTRKVAELRKEIKTATAIQQQILPERPAQVPGFDLAGQSISSGAVGGDYFDFLAMGDARTLVVIADVSGHNLASGMIMVSVRATLRVLAQKAQRVAGVFDDLAACLFKDLSRTERFITAAGVALAPRKRTVELVNAGHCDTMVFRAQTKRVDRIPSASSVLGFLPVFEHPTRLLRMKPGDVLLLYTDGITETQDAAGEMFGEERLAQLLARSAKLPAQEILGAVFAAADAFADGSGKGDDITAVVVKAIRV